MIVDGAEHDGETHSGLSQAKHAPGSNGRPEHRVTAVSSWARAFPGSPRQVSAARQFVASALDGSPWREDAVIVVSELFTNALRHTQSGQPGGLVVVGVSQWPQGVRVAVTDQGSANQPVIRNPGPNRQPVDSGNGLYLVACLSGRLEWHEDAWGRTVCAVLGRPAVGQHPCCPGESGSVALPPQLPQVAAQPA
jgi:anti-sigma regulatory factor (Ser/Thr protein kinase)